MRILLATDGSDFSNRAVEACCDLILNPYETKLMIVAAYEPPVAMAAEPFAMSAGYYQDLAEIVKTKADEAAKQATASIRRRFPTLPVEITVDIGRPQEVIIETAEQWDADLIVVGSHGYGFWGRAMLGSVSDAVVHHAACSVLIVRE